MGHPPAAVWKYTPKQMHAFLFLAGKRRQREDRAMLALHTLAARGDPKALRKQLKDEGE